MNNDLFDEKALALRRRRAESRGFETFLHDRALEDIVDRLAMTSRRFDSALVIGGASPSVDPLMAFASRLQRVDPSGLLSVEPAAFDLCVALGELDSVNALPQVLLPVRFALRPDSLFIGALSGGETLPRLRSAMRAADEQVGTAAPRVHPRIDPNALAGLLSDAGFVMPVIDVDRVRVAYRSLGALVRDLRSMAATNALTARSRRPLTRRAAAAAERSFMLEAEDGRVTETFEILHFAAWTPAASQG